MTPAAASPPKARRLIIARLVGERQAEEALHYVAPVGEKEAYVDRAMAAVRPFLAAAVAA